MEEHKESLKSLVESACKDSVYKQIDKFDPDELLEKATSYLSFSDNEEYLTVAKKVIGQIHFDHDEDLLKASSTEEKDEIIRQGIINLVKNLNLSETISKAMDDSGLNEIKKEIQELRLEINNLNSENSENLKLLNSIKERNYKNQMKLFNKIVFTAESNETTRSETIVVDDDDDDIEILPQPNVSNNLLDKSVSVEEEKTSNEEFLRLVSPVELIKGLRGDVLMPVLAKHGRDTWHPGRIENILEENNEDRKYRVSLEGKGTTKVVNSQHIAVAVSAFDKGEIYPVGTRVVSIYRDDQGGLGYYSGVVAEPPSERNNKRYLLFFDDGYTQYSSYKEVYRIFHQSPENWRELSEDSQEFVKKYLEQYPERPMVRMRINQIIRTELNGNWLPATVDHVDASLVLMRFNNSHKEWIYRGSTRLEPLYAELMAANNRGNKRTARQMIGGHKGATIEYNNPVDESTAKRRSVARKSTAARTKDENTTRPLNMDLSEYDENQGSLVSTLTHLVKNRSDLIPAPHKCSNICLTKNNVNHQDKQMVDLDDPFTHKPCNPLEIPILSGWARLRGITNGRTNRDLICYRTPCGRSLRTMNDVERYLVETDSKLTIDLFCFDVSVKVNVEFKALNTLTHIADMSYGRENVPIACVNSLDNDVPLFIDYLPIRSATSSVPLNEDEDFLVCCDCTDNCRNRAKCACQQLTIEASSYGNPRNQTDPRAGYHFKRLHNYQMGGIYECNSRCKCDRRCRNRVVQHGIWAKLQIFKTEKKGWGIRALHSIPKGAFVSIYAGAIYDENTAVAEGCKWGDEYQAELDYIETIETHKEGYESDVPYSDLESDQGDEEEEEEDCGQYDVTSEDDLKLLEKFLEEELEEEESDSSSDESTNFKSNKFSDQSQRRTNPSRQAKNRLKKEKAKKRALDRLKKLKKTENQDSRAYIGKLMPSPKKNPDINRAIVEDESDTIKSRAGGRRSTGGKMIKSKGRVQVDKLKPRPSIRFYFNEENPFVMDAKKAGNLGRYFNHSCSPNVFVQNVFIKTHDPRFPEVAFFAKKNIDAGEEMTWDYNYQVGSVADKILYCYCGSADCRGRLL